MKDPVTGKYSLVKMTGTREKVSDDDQGSVMQLDIETDEDSGFAAALRNAVGKENHEETADDDDDLALELEMEMELENME